MTSEKEAAVIGNLPPVEATLPGWGFWTGVGSKTPNFIIRKEKEAREKFESDKKKLMSSRKDAALAHVMINEKRDKKVLFENLMHCFL